MADKTFDDPVFGELTWDEHGQWWIGEVDLTPRHTVEVFLSDLGHPPGEEALAVCRATCQNVRRKEYDHRHATADGLVEMYNNDWRQSDEEEEETRESFAAKLTLVTIALYAEGEVELYFADGGRFFGGRSIKARIDSDGMFIEANLG